MAGAGAVDADAGEIAADLDSNLNLHSDSNDVHANDVAWSAMGLLLLLEPIPTDHDHRSHLAIAK